MTRPADPHLPLDPRADDDGSLGRAVRVWADESVPMLPAAFTDDVVRAAMGSVPVTARVADVVPLASRSPRKSRAVWAAVPLFAAAAAAVFTVVSHGGSGSVTSIAPPDRVVAVANPSDVHTNTNESHGSEVIAVEGDAPAGYTVMQLDGTREGSTVALVWFNDDGPAKATGR